LAYEISNVEYLPHDVDHKRDRTFVGHKELNTGRNPSKDESLCLREEDSDKLYQL